MSATTPHYTIVIPARFGSTRFPGKILHQLNGRPMLAHVIDRARDSAAGEIIVATDDKRIADVALSCEVEAVMTDPQHPSGTDRIAEVARSRDWPDDHIIVGLQGDEPTLPAALLDGLANNLKVHPEASMATWCAPLGNADEFQNPDRVKVVRDGQGMALYFSRSPIPHVRGAAADAPPPPNAAVHIGIYAYRRGFLQAYASLAPTVLEQLESLEQLRALEHGFRIHVGVAPVPVGRGVDRLEDVAEVLSVLAARSVGR